MGMQTSVRQLAHTPAKEVNWRLDGWGGILYALTHLAMLGNSPEFMAEAEAIPSPAFPVLIEHDDALDIIGGAAGCIGGLIGFNRCTGSRGAVEAARSQCGDRLISTGRTVDASAGLLQTTTHRSPGGMRRGWYGLGTPRGGGGLGGGTISQSRARCHGLRANLVLHRSGELA